MAKYNSSGWHFQTTRHSNARKTGHAGGTYAKTTYSKKVPEGFAFVDWKDDNGKKYKDVMPRDALIYNSKMTSRATKIMLSEDDKDTDRDGVPDKYDCQPRNPKAQDTFNVGNGYTIEARAEKTRNGFRHVARLMKDGREIDSNKVTYLNRTWERYEFETVMNNLLQKNEGIISPAQRKSFLEKAERVNKEEVEAKFGSIATIAKLGEVFAGDSKKEKNDWKKRMLKAGLPQLDIPEDWDKLSEKEKEKRLDNVIAVMQKPHTATKEERKKDSYLSSDSIVQPTKTEKLESRYGNQKSFDGKAKIKYVNGDTVLLSYNQPVASIRNGKPEVYGTYSNTTTRHIKEFLKQNGFKADSTKQIMQDYAKKETD